MKRYVACSFVVSLLMVGCSASNNTGGDLDGSGVLLDASESDTGFSLPDLDLPSRRDVGRDAGDVSTVPDTDPDPDVEDRDVARDVARDVTQPDIDSPDVDPFDAADTEEDTGEDVTADGGPDDPDPIDDVSDDVSIDTTPRDTSGPDTDTGCTSASCGAPCVEVTPGSIDWGTLDVGFEARRSVRVRNCASPGGRHLSLERIEVMNDEGRGAFRFESTPMPAIALAPGASHTFPVFFLPLSAGLHTDSLEIEVESGSFSQTDLVPLRGTGRAVAVECPRAVPRCRLVSTGGSWSPSLTATALAEVECEASASVGVDGAEIVGWNWSVVEHPLDRARAFATPTASTQRLVLNAAGTWRVQLHVTDADGTRSCDPGIATIESTPRGRVYVELWWEGRTTGGTVNSGGDWDIHLIRDPGGTWFSTTSDCHYSNCRAPTGGGDSSPHLPSPLDWGAAGSQDNPRLAIEAISNGGPEVAWIDWDTGFADFQVGIGVHAYSNATGASTWGSLRVYLDGELHLERTEKTMVRNQVWEVMRVDGRTGSAVEFDQVIGNVCQSTRWRYTGTSTSTYCP